VITEKVKYSKVSKLDKVAQIMNNHMDDIGVFLTENQQGKHIPTYLTEISKYLINEQTEICERLRTLSDNVQHIKEIISTQKSYSKVSGVEVTTSISELVEDAIQIHSASLQRHGTQLIREFEELPDIRINKQRVLQILLNLMKNAKHATSNNGKEEKIITIRIYKNEEDRFRIEVADNGIGIHKDNLIKIFNHGFTTKKHGHGFGLHFSALASQQLGGSLTVQSDGEGQGATFTLELPYEPAKVAP
jgi:signal transduction histidine kinase